jgi:hypothetical protein
VKHWAPHILFSVLLLLGAANVLAQDAGMSDTEIVNERDVADPEKLVFTPGEMEVRYIPRASGVYAPSDSLALHALDFPMQQAAQRPTEKNEKQGSSKTKDDSILTFNFLYYIIQKYKLQDIID